MSKFCSNCGQEMDDTTKFCPACGQEVGGQVNQTIINNYSNASRPIIPNRNIALAIVLTFVTCGIYGIYWFIVMTDEANSVSDEKNAGGLTAFIFSLITCGIYGWYWNYKMGQKLAAAGKKYNMAIADNGVLYLILAIFGLGIVNYCLIQNDLNRFSNE